MLIKLIDIGVFQAMIPDSGMEPDAQGDQSGPSDMERQTSCRSFETGPDILEVNCDILLLRLSFQSCLVQQGVYALWTQQQKEQLAVLVKAVLSVKDEVDTQRRGTWHKISRLASSLCQPCAAR